MEKKRIALLVVSIIAALGCLGFMGLKTFCEKIFDSRDCEWANIDNIEMHARIDIPATTDCHCEYNEITATKKAVFSLEKGKLPEDYAVKNKLTKTEADAIAMADFNFENKRAILPAGESLYYREGKTSREDYKIIYDPKAGKIWVNLKFLD